jgi:hypothetical protein
MSAAPLYDVEDGFAALGARLDRIGAPEVAAFTATVRQLVAPALADLRTTLAAFGRRFDEQAAILADLRNIVDGVLRHQAMIGRELGTIDAAAPKLTRSQPVG